MYAHYGKLRRIVGYGSRVRAELVVAPDSISADQPSEILVNQLMRSHGADGVPFTNPNVPRVSSAEQFVKAASIRLRQRERSLEERMAQHNQQMEQRVARALQAAPPAPDPAPDPETVENTPGTSQDAATPPATEPTPPV